MVRRRGGSYLELSVYPSDRLNVRLWGEYACWKYLLSWRVYLRLAFRGREGSLAVQTEVLTSSMHCLGVKSSSLQKEDRNLPQCILEVFRRDAIRIVWRWSEGDRKVTKCYVEQILYSSQFRACIPGQKHCVPQHERKCRTRAVGRG